MSSTTDLAYLTIRQASELIRARKLSPVELTKAALERIERLDGRFHAFIRLTPDIAMAGARAAEAQIMAGDWRGPLHGVPYALKDIIDYAGLPTTCHSKIMKDHIAAADAPVTQRLKAAGGVFLGKLSTHEFAIGGPSFDLPWPPAVNPWSGNGGPRFPGGSSSGSGVALAAGYVPATLGTDTGGSIRNPASMCAIVGMKATYGRVSRRGVFPLSYSLDHVGPMTRDVADNALLLGILAGHDPEDPASADVATADYTAGLGKGAKGLVIGLARHFYAEDAVADPEQLKAIDDAAEIFRRLGAEVREIKLPSGPEFYACCRLILRSEAYAIHRKWVQERPQDYGEIARSRFLDGATVSAADYIDALRWKGRLVRQTLAAMADVDVLLTASSLDPPCRIDDPEAVQRAYPRQVRQPFNVTGQPALAMPAGFTAEGLTLSLQLVGHPFQEATVYRVAAAYEAASGWTSRRPPI